MTTAPGTLVCPKCQGQMRTYERSGIHIDQCQECRGVIHHHRRRKGLLSELFD